MQQSSIINEQFVSDLNTATKLKPIDKAVTQKDEINTRQKQEGFLSAKDQELQFQSVVLDLTSNEIPSENRIILKARRKISNCDSGRRKEESASDVLSQFWSLVLFVFCQWRRCLASLKLMARRNHPEFVALVNSILLPLLISLFAEIGPVTTKKLYIAYREGPFFPNNSNIVPPNFIDVYTGKLEGLSHIYAASNVVVFMSYTHWSINCQDSRDVFLELAREFSESDDETTEKVAFVAINCWLPKSQCRKVSRAIGPFPRFIIYIPELSRHVWYSGPVTVTAIRNEIARLLQPYTVVSTIEELREAMTRHPSTLVLAPSQTTLATHSYLTHFLKVLHMVGSRMSSIVQVAPWSTPQMIVINDPTLRRYVCALDCGFSIQRCNSLTTENIAVLYRGQKSIKFIQLTNDETLFDNIFSAVRTLLAPSIGEKVWRESPMLYMYMPGIVSIPSVSARSSISLDGVLKNNNDFTFVLNSNSPKLIEDFLDVKNLLERCRNHYKKLYCVSQINNREVKRNDSENGASVSYCQFCSKHANVSKTVSLMHHNGSSDFNRYFLLGLQNSFQKFCYPSFHELQAVIETVEEDVAYQNRLSGIKSALFATRKTNLLDELFLSLSTCTHNKSMTFAISSQIHQCDPDIETCLGLNYSYLMVYDRLSNNQVYKLSPLGSIEDFLQVLSDIVRQSYSVITSNLIHFLKPPSHFLHEKLGVAVLSNELRKTLSYTSKLKYGDMNPSDNKGVTYAKLSSYCRSDDIWSGANSNNCLVLHYNSWCGFCKTVMHVFQTVGSMMTSAFPNVTDFVKVNSGIERIPEQHKFAKFPTIVFYPAAENCRKEYVVDEDGIKVQKISQMKNFTYTYPDDIAVTVPNLYGFVRLHSGVY